MIVLDTNVLSEIMRPAPSAEVVHWMEAQPATSLFTTTLTRAEILYGLALLPAGRRRKSLETAVRLMFEEDFAGRVLSFDSHAAQEFARITADRRRKGRPISQLDAQIAAVARSRSAALATRNKDDFTGCGIELVNPWSQHLTRSS